MPPSLASLTNDIGAYGGPYAREWQKSAAPVIVQQPQGQSLCVGQTASFSIIVIGAEPMRYQWYFNGNAISPNSTTNLTLALLQNIQAGIYTVVVSNMFGSVTSAPVQLGVFDACVDIHMYAGLNISGETGGSYEIRYTTNLVNTNFTNWTLVETFVMPAGGWFYLDRGSPLSPRRFYGVKRL